MKQDDEPRRLKLLLHCLAEWVEPHIIEGGRDYYEFDYVLRLEVEGDAIHALVRGSQGPYNTTVNLADFSKSECDCPYEDYCKHMVAVVYAAAQHDKDIVTDEKSVPTVDSVMTLLATLLHRDLLEVISLALEDKPKLAAHISLWFDRFTTRQDMKRVLVGMNTLEAVQYFDSRVANVVMEAERMFESHLSNDETEEYDSWGDSVYSMDIWHCQEGVSHVRNWCDALLEALTDETVISVVVGLALTVSRVSRWPKLYPEEAQRELSDALSGCRNVLDEAVGRLQFVMERNLHLWQQYVAFTDWMTDGCKNMGYLVDWTEALSSCVLDGPHLMRVYDRLLTNNPAFLLSDELLDETGSSSKEYNGYGRYLVDWWCRMCLLHGKVEEAEKALLPSFTEAGPIADIATIQMLANYFVSHGQRRKAAHYTGLAVRLNPHASAQDYEWVAEMYQSIQMMPESVRAREQAFLSWPTWERFEQWIHAVPSIEDRQGKVKERVGMFVNQGQIGLACRMLWTVGLIDEAWSVISGQRIKMHLIDDNLAEFLKHLETYNVEQAVTVYEEIALVFIRDGHIRSAYREGAAWLQAMHDAWVGANQQDTWRHFIQAFHREYQRLPALQDELRKAGLV
ncbi:SWIM zinc finger family protein [Alicyclobacillus sp. ALC3]|uniref:SWIM zinc finger family protein n=1 Tax=Alicyclobacillus sp. ALC3 TaxID=2796143 RepID=UPI002377E161|nr:SWIM zinc finger family protein [Alicyclobacillus sp. ALC3]WDL95324.1 SWIM zinc finger family protein [Alicyclobacillus sp. ALC3]